MLLFVMSITPWTLHMFQTLSCQSESYLTAQVHDVHCNLCSSGHLNIVFDLFYGIHIHMKGMARKIQIQNMTIVFQSAAMAVCAGHNYMLLYNIMGCFLYIQRIIFSCNPSLTLALSSHLTGSCDFKSSNWQAGKTKEVTCRALWPGAGCL